MFSSRMEDDGILLFDPDYEWFDEEQEDVGTHQTSVGAKVSVFERLGPSPPRQVSGRKSTRWEAPTSTTPCATPRVTRWDVAPAGHTTEAVVPATPVGVVTPTALGCQETINHWSAVRLPYQLTTLVTKRGRQGGNKMRAEQVLKKILFADQKCGSTTPTAVLQQLVKDL